MAATPLPETLKPAAAASRPETTPIAPQESGARAAQVKLGNIFEKPAAQAAAAAQQQRSPEGDIANGLLNLEREARRALSEAELGYLMVNGSRIAMAYRQALLIMRSGPKGQRVVAVSSLSAIDRNSTFIRWVERMAEDRLTGEALGKIVALDTASAAKADPDAAAYPFPHILFLPLALRDGTVFAHLMLAHETPWSERSMVAGARLCETYSHAWEALSGPVRTKRKLRSKRLAWLAGGAAMLLAGFIPVPLSALAPAEITAANAFVVAAPIDGTVQQVEVDPNTQVAEGDVLFSYTDTELRNRVDLAGQAVRVAEARYQQNLRTSFSDPMAKRELSISQSELKLKTGEYNYASELMNRSIVRADRAGLVIFDAKDTWTGRPVKTGERIMRIADPADVEVRVDLPVADAIVLEPKAPVSVYLDSDPLTPLKAELESASFHATPDGLNTLAYTVRAKLTGEGASPRIGLRGTAKVYGEDVSLAYFLFRKPLATIRQWTGL